MSIIQELSSQAHIGSSKANLAVAKKCLADPSLLADVAANLNSHDKCLAGDCAEVMTMTAQERPDLVAPYAEALCPQIKHKAMRARWEATHALALVAHLRPEVIEGILSQLARTIEDDTSVIVRDYSVDTVANYTCAGAEESRMAFPILKRATIVWAGRHAGHALVGLKHVVENVPELRPEILTIAQPFVEDRRGVVRKAAGKIASSYELRAASKKQSQRD